MNDGIAWALIGLLVLRYVTLLHDLRQNGRQILVVLTDVQVTLARLDERLKRIEETR